MSDYQAQFSTDLDQHPRWYALSVKPQHEKRVATRLRYRGWEEFLPLHRSQRFWSDRIKKLDLPLFPGYVFCRFSLENHRSVLDIPSVTSIVGFGNVPTPVTDKEIFDLKNLVAAGFPMEPWPFLKIGQKIRIDRGSLKGLEGILLQVRDSWRVIVSLFLLQRSIAVEIDAALVSAIPNSGVQSGIRYHRLPHSYGNASS